VQNSSLHSDPEVAAAFWSNFEIQRWQAALQMEQQKASLYAIRIHLHLYYAWAYAELAGKTGEQRPV
jgi:hypothetical protein